MGSFYNDASLVMIPSGYKDQKVYCAKPADGSGDLVFSRASDATRVASNGLIEKVRTNLCLQSNGFNTAPWTVSSATVTSGQAGYDGTNNAYELTSTVAGGNIFQTNTQSGVQTYSVYAKGSVSNGIRLFAPGTVNCSAYFNLNLGTVGTITGGATAKIDSVGNGWFRCSISFDQTNLTLRFYPTNNANAQAAGTIFIQNSQLETGDIATDYIATTATAVSVGPVSGLPRLDYYDSTCPKLILEPQRTNLALYSEQFNNASWTKLNATVTANAAASPDGYVNADKLTANSGAVLSSISNYALQTITKAASAIQYTYSVFAKQSGLNRINVFAQGTSAANHALFTVSLVNGTISTAAESAGTFTGASASVSDYGNGWYRCALVFTTNTDTALTVRNIPTDSTLTTGNGTDGILIYGAQLEQGAYATSYIPTLSASVTRVADAATKTGISALIGQTEGTFFLEFAALFNSVVNEQISLSDGTDNNTIKFVLGSVVGGVKAEGKVAGAGQFGITKSTSDYLSTKKIAVAYKANDFVFYYDGVLIGSDTSGSVPAMSVFNFAAGSGVFPSNINVKQMLVFKTRLTDSQLQELTTL